ncbi:hypothetical protein [Morganella morganii IS15]|nr:hypothetical protein [Morganella morganii IS15]
MLWTSLPVIQKRHCIHREKTPAVRTAASAASLCSGVKSSKGALC